MNKSEELKNTTAIVRNLLINNPQTRNSDDYLYFKVCETIAPECVSNKFWYVLLNRKHYNLPAFESVRRSRQKLQEKCPELAGNDDVEGYRALMEEVFKDYAKGAV
jgi:hypothetical protein